MSRIRLLSEQLANQIAAGEVVERPASVVKELLENSIDAGASRIHIQIEGDGIRLIRVVDNGEGMDGDDVLLCIERHATSKLRNEAQLAAITTLGFRGEALPSIGSVSRLTILSRPLQQAIGTRAEVRYGTLHAMHDDGCAQGTVMEVRGLFDNMPARKKFLKSGRTELFHIEEAVRDQALAHPEIAFLLEVDGRARLDVTAVALPEERVRAIFGFSGNLLPLHSHRPERHLEVEGYLLAPDQIQPSQEKLRTLVNGRPVQDRTIRHAIVSGLQGFLMKGQMPAGAIWLHISPEQVDINVHPAKREIRFRDAREIHAFLSEAVVQATLRHQQNIRSELFNSRTMAAQPESPAPAPKQMPPPPRWPALEQAVPLFPQANCAEPARIRENAFRPQALQPNAPQAISPAPCPMPHRRDDALSPPAESQIIPSGIRAIGQLFSLYLLCEKEDSLIVIDQHAAHERILYQQLRTSYEKRQLVSQQLLFPVTVELQARQGEVMEQAQETIQDLGFSVQHFGEESWVIQAVPALLQHIPPRELLADILNALSKNPVQADPAVLVHALDELLASMACKAAIKSGNRLQAEETLELLRQMEESEVFSHCPHGRPVIRQFPREEIARWFKR